MEAREELEEDIAHIVPHKPYPQYIDETVFLELKSLLNQHPDDVFSVWANQNPRLFLLLRMLGCDDDALYQRLDSENIGDYWVPLGSSTLKQLSSFTNVSAQDWRRAQYHVLSQPELMNEHKFLSSLYAHRHLQRGNAHFEEIEKLGKGGSAEVARVRHNLSAREFACKRIRRAPEVKNQRKQLIEFVAEVSVLKRVNHHHLVSLVASFTDLASFSLILSPVCKDVLKSMLERHAREQPLPDSDIATLRRSFGCLAAALAYLHSEDVRHKDIKPGNILLSDGRVYLCDFGISRDLSKAEHSTTNDEVLKVTPRYCAPEVFGREPRNKRSDVWSLGCVFLEIITVVKGYPLEELNEFLLDASDHESSRGLWCAPDAMRSWLEHIRSDKNDTADDIPLGWIISMIRFEKEDRVAASDVVKMAVQASSELESPDLYIGSCCTRADSVAFIDTLISPGLDENDPYDPGRFERTRKLISWQLLSIRSGSHDISTPYGDPNLLTPPSRTARPPGERASDASPNPRKISEDRSVSPHTRESGLDDETDTTSFGGNISRPSSRDESFEIISHGSNKWSGLSERSRAGTKFPFPATLRSRSPVPPPARFDVKCSCSAQPQERHILNIKHISPGGDQFFDSNLASVVTCAKCEVGENKVQLYETFQPTYQQADNNTVQKLWHVTRRLVVSYVSGQPKMRHCSAFWLPLTDTRLKVENNTVTLEWSDCNQMTERMSGNYSTYYDWMYNPEHPNNSVRLTFTTPNDALKFVDAVRLPYEDDENVRNCRGIDISDHTMLNIYDVGRDIPLYRAAVLTVLQDSWITSKIFIQWPEADPHIRLRDSFDARSAATPGFEMVVEMNNMSTPTYLSDLRGEPAADYDKVAYFSEAHNNKASLAVAFQIGLQHGLPTPPDGMKSIVSYIVAMLTSLRRNGNAPRTDWVELTTLLRRH